MNQQVIDNFARLRSGLFYLPVFLLLILALFLYINDALHTSGYIHIQQDLFFYLNAELSRFPRLQYNLTQTGDALVMLSLLSVFLYYAPALWESLISVSLISAAASALLKNIFAIPRPAAVFDTAQFVILGQKLPGHSSLPSGHSITIFTSLTVLLFAFMPARRSHRLLWILLFLLVGAMLAFTRVGVGAHYPLDVLTGGMVGYLSALAGIFFSRRFRIWSWVGQRKHYPLLILILLGSAVALLLRIRVETLPIYYLALASLILSLYILSHATVQK